MVSTTKLDVIAVETAEHVESLRRLRNANIGSFSHDNSEISQSVQHAWWIAMRDKVNAWLYYLPLSPQRPIGYGLVRQLEDDTWWNSIAVHPSFHGRGFGSFITSDVLQRHVGTVFASVKRDNAAGIAMHHTHDWELIEGPDDRLIYLRSRS